MPTPIREQIVAAFAAKLAAIASVAGLTVEREREDPVTSGEVPFLAVYEEDAAPDSVFAGEIDVILPISVEGIVAGDTRLAARQAAAVLQAEVEKAIFADVTLGGLARDILPGAEQPPARLDADVPDIVASFAITFDISFAVAETDPYSLP